MAAAVPKCFYHQTDHWTGSVVQGAAGAVELGGPLLLRQGARHGRRLRAERPRRRRPVDPRLLPGFPPEYQAYFGPGGGGAYTDTVAAEPDCAAKVDTPEEVKKVYRAGGGTRSRDRACAEASGEGSARGPAAEFLAGPLPCGLPTA